MKKFKHSNFARIFFKNKKTMSKPVSGFTPTLTFASFLKFLNNFGKKFNIFSNKKPKKENEQSNKKIMRKLVLGFTHTPFLVSLHAFLTTFSKRFNIFSNKEVNKKHEQDNRKEILGKVSGFTLIELLVVVAIIGILTSIVLVALSDSKNRGGDASVQSNLDTVKNQAEIFYSDNDNSFLPLNGTVFNINACPSYNSLGSNMFSKNKIIASAIIEATKRGSGQNSCYNSSISWALAVSLRTNANTSWCVDSEGTAKEIASVPASAINQSTFSCN